MFVSSYNMYLNSLPSQKVAGTQTEKRESASSNFKLQLTKNKHNTTPYTKKLPIDYLNNRAYSNRYKLEEHIDNSLQQKFTKIKAMGNAQSAYSQNAVMFSFLQKPKLTINQNEKQKISKNLPEDIKKIKENNLRTTMIHTYIANESYFKITA